MLPKGHLIGNLTNDPSGGVSQAGMAYSRFSVACNEDRTAANPNPKAHFFNCVAFSQRAEYINKYITKGDTVYLEFLIKTDNYTPSEGKSIKTTDLIIMNVQTLRRSNKNSAQNNPSHVPTNIPTEQPPQKTNFTLKPKAEQPAAKSNDDLVSIKDKEDKQDEELTLDDIYNN